MRAREENASRRLYVPDSGFLFVATNELTRDTAGNALLSHSLRTDVCDTAYQ